MRPKNYVYSKETREKMSLARLGKKLPEKTKENMRKSARRGKDNPLWRGGTNTYEHHLLHNKQRKIKKEGNGGSHTLGEWETLKAQYNWTCPCCKKQEPFNGQHSEKLTEDHIIPISKGGSDNIENIQPLCHSCNSKKHNKVIKY